MDGSEHICPNSLISVSTLTFCISTAPVKVLYRTSKRLKGRCKPRNRMKASSFLSCENISCMSKTRLTLNKWRFKPYENRPCIHSRASTIAKLNSATAPSCQRINSSHYQEPRPGSSASSCRILWGRRATGGGASTRWTGGRWSRRTGSTRSGWGGPSGTAGSRWTRRTGTTSGIFFNWHWNKLVQLDPKYVDAHIPEMLPYDSGSSTSTS